MLFIVMWLVEFMRGYFFLFWLLKFFLLTHKNRTEKETKNGKDKKRISVCLRT